MPSRYAPSKASPAMSLPQRTIGRGSAGLTGSAVAFGCMSLVGGLNSGTPDEEESIKIIRHALSTGVTVLNTANLYGRKQENEIAIGKALQGLSRENVIIVDKFGVLMTEKGFEFDASPEQCRKTIDAQLARLQTDYIDVWVYRCKDPKTPIEDTVRAMKEAVVAGKVRHLGLSECSAEDIRKAHAIHPISLIEQEWSLFTRDIEEDLLPTTNELGIGVLAYSPLGRGWLTGALKSPADLPENDFRRNFPQFKEDVFEQNRALVKRVEALAEKKGCTSGQLAIAWLLHKSPNVIPLFGTKSIKNIDANIIGARIELTPEEFAAIDTSISLSEVKGDRYPGMAHSSYHYSKVSH